MIRALLFDCDGVLADNETLHYRALAEALRPEGIHLGQEEYGAVVGMPDPSAVQAVLEAASAAADGEKVKRIVAAKTAAYRRSLAAGIAPVPGAADFIRSASRDYLLAVASGAWGEEVALVLDGLEVRDRFRAVVALEDAPRGKPDPAPFLLALARLNASDPSPDPPVEPRDCIVFEDSVHGIVAARAAGMRSVGLTTSLPGSRLRDADLVVPNFRGLDLARMTAFFDRRARS